MATPVLAQFREQRTSGLFASGSAVHAYFLQPIVHMVREILVVFIAVKDVQ